MSSVGSSARLKATAEARKALSSGGHVITPRLQHIFQNSPNLDETWIGHCERCGESFSMTNHDDVWQASGMVYVWESECRGEWRSYYYEEDDYNEDD